MSIEGIFLPGCGCFLFFDFGHDGVVGINNLKRPLKRQSKKKWNSSLENSPSSPNPKMTIVIAKIVSHFPWIEIMIGANSSMVSILPILLVSIVLNMSCIAYRLLESTFISSCESNQSFIGAAPLRVIVMTTYRNVSWVHPLHKSAKQSGMHG